MKNVTLKDILTIIHRTINSVDNRLLDHGEQVAYIMMNLLRADGKYSEEEIIKICSVSMFHDIGAYKVTEIDKLVDIDSVTPYKHAIYGALFIKTFSPLSNLSGIVLGHHFTPEYIKNRNLDFIPEEALLLGLADYIGVIHLNNIELNEKNFTYMRDTYLQKHIDLFIKSDKEKHILNKLRNKYYKKELYDFFSDREVSREEVIKYVKMLTYAIDFRSEVTVKHTIIVESVSYEIAKLYNMDENTLMKIRISAAVHDIGKIAVPVDILEKPGKLTSMEYEEIKNHAIIGYKILSNLNIDDIRDIATLHHEKLDGTGYPFGLKGEEISMEMRIVAVADILSALVGVRSYKDEFNKEKVITILTTMVRENKIDKDIINLVVNNYDSIMKEAYEQSENLMSKYINIQSEYKRILDKL